MNPTTILDAVGLPSDDSRSLFSRFSPDFQKLFKKIQGFVLRKPQEKSPSVTAQQTQVSTQVGAALVETPRMHKMKEVVGIVVNARKAFNESKIIMSVESQNKLFTLCYELFLPKIMVVLDNPQANIGPLTTYLSHIGTNIDEIKTLCGVGKV